MINYDSLQTALESVIRTVYGADVSLYWTNDSEEAHYLPFPVIALTLRSEVSFGIDEQRDTGDPVPDGVDADRMVRIEGQRSVVWVVRIETDQQTPLNQSARALMSQLRTRLRRPDIRAILRASGIALSRMDSPVDLDYEADSRMLSASSMDVTLLTTSADTESYGVQEIRSAGFVNEIPDPDSTFEVESP